MAWIDVIIWVLRGNYYHIHFMGQVYGNCFIDFATVLLTVGLTKDSLLEIGHFWSCNKWGKSYFMFKPWMSHFWEASSWGFRLFESLILVLLACSFIKVVAAAKFLILSLIITFIPTYILDWNSLQLGFSITKLTIT